MSGKYGIRQAFLKMAKDIPESLDTLVRYPSTMIVVGVGAVLLLIGETSGTAQELPTGTIDPSDLASMERSGLGGISVPATATQNGQATASPGQWLIDDVARERAELELRHVSPKPLSATSAVRDTAYVEAGVGLPSPTAEGGRLRAAPSQRALKRPDGASPRPDPSPGLVASATKCAEAPVGLAPEGEHWYYQLDRETHRKCWRVRAVRDDRAQGSIVESGGRQSELTSPALLNWAWWPWR
jgi:hypothetical protein